MRHLTVIVMLSLFSYSLLAQDIEAVEGEGETTSEGLVFSYEILEPVAETSDISASGDTVFFTLYYIDVTCFDYKYEFEKRENQLAICRVANNPESCVTDSEQLYAVKGIIANVPKGKYLFELEASLGAGVYTLYHDVVTVR